MVIGMKHHVADRGARQILPQRLPILPVIKRDVDRGLGTGKEQALLIRVLANHVHPASRGLIAGQSMDDLRPGFAAIVRAPDQWNVGAGEAWALGGGPSAGGRAARNIGSVRVSMPRLNGVEGDTGTVCNVAH